MSQFKQQVRAFLATPTDAELEEQISAALRGDSRVDLTEISVRVEGGTVHLAGMVDSAAERKAAQEDAETIVARDKIVDRLTLRDFVERTNEELVEEVRHAMKRSLDLDTVDVALEADQGVVTLQGRVRSFAQKLAVENIVWWTPGVTDAVSRLQVDGVDEPPDEPDY
jgi:hyperosmotically inducible protein